MCLQWIAVRPHNICIACAALIFLVKAKNSDVFKKIMRYKDINGHLNGVNVGAMHKNDKPLREEYNYDRHPHLGGI